MLTSGISSTLTSQLEVDVLIGRHRESLSSSGVVAIAAASSCVHAESSMLMVMMVGGDLLSVSS